MIGAPTEREFQLLVHLNLLKDCPITNSDIINAHKIFGPDLANLRGKMVCQKPRHVVIKCLHFVELPAPDSVIQRVNSLAGNSGVFSTLVFADRHKKPFAWPENTPTPTALDPTPMVVYLRLPAEMP